MKKFLELCSQNFSSSRERVQCVQELLKSNELDPERRDNDGWCAIHYAAFHGRPEIIDLLLPYQYAETSRTRFTAMHIACANNRLDVVETLLQYYRGAAPSRDRDGNTPLHLACKEGSVEIASRLLNKYPKNCIYDTNGNRATPLGIAVEGNSFPLAKLLLSQSVGNPTTSKDFLRKFPTFRNRQSLDYPMSVFVMGNRQTGKSTLIKSLQVEGYLRRTIGVIKSTSGVQHQSGGVVTSDVSSFGYGRAKFYELASGQQSTQKSPFLSLADPAHSLFVVMLSFKDERKEMEANLHYWLSFIYHHFRSAGVSIRPNVAVVGSFLFYQRLGSIRLDNRHRLHLVYNKIKSSYNDLCSHLSLLGKYSMDCRRSESPGMRQLRTLLHNQSLEIRPSGGEIDVPSSCYVLLNALDELSTATSGIPVIRLQDIESHIKENSCGARSFSLFSLLPSDIEDLKPMLEVLNERKAIAVLDFDPRDPWIIFDEFELISQIDNTLTQSILQDSYFNAAVMSLDDLLNCFSSLTTYLTKEALLNILHYFKVAEEMIHSDTTEYFLPHILQMSQKSNFPAWKKDSSNFGFAWCIVPETTQVAPFFIPRFLYFMLYELFASTKDDDLDTVEMLRSGLHCKLSTQLEVFVVINSSAIILNMQCSEEGEIACLQYRNKFLSTIHRQRNLHQPRLKVSEYIIPMEQAATFPIQTPKRIQVHGTDVKMLKNAILQMQTIPNFETLISFEPYTWLSKLEETHLKNLLDYSFTNVEATKEFLQDLATGVGSLWDGLLKCSELHHPLYGQLLEFFTTMSIFQTKLELIKGLKVYLIYFKVLFSFVYILFVFLQPGHPLYLMQSGSTTSSSVSTPSQPNLHNIPPPTPSDATTIQTCSSKSDKSSIKSDVLNIPSVISSVSTSVQQHAPFITNTEIIHCDANGAKFHHEVHNITFVIPPEAVKVDSHITLEFGVATVGPFQFPDGYAPVSPILWVQIQRGNGNENLQKALEISIPHAVDWDENFNLMHLMCAQKCPHGYSFTKAHKRAKIDSSNGMLYTKLSKQQYFFCIAGKICHEVKLFPVNFILLTGSCTSL